MKNPFLIGEKVYLRPLEREDAPTLQRFINHPEVRRTINPWRPMMLQNELEFLERAATSPNEMAFGVALVADDRLIGTTGFHPIEWRDRSAMFGIEIGEPGEWGKGYGTEATRLTCQHAFDRLNLNRVWLVVYESNERGRRAYQRVGFRDEGRMRQCVWREGRWLDAYLMALLAEEWRELQR